ncbi:MAG: hypothetical protein E7561_03825 [Ruminococcaceae bacterium]|nr:hypothetical protein [Oscillospiraceae bacterium]
MSSFIKRFFVLLLAFLIILSVCGCKKDNKDPKSIPADNSSTVNNTEVNPNNITVNEADDTADPENTESSIEGDRVEVQKLEVRKGAANGIDVSKWQGKIDWKKVKQSGIDFAIIRIGYRGENGKLYRDSNADYNIQQATKSGLLVGVYFFSTAINTTEAKEEAEWTVSAIKGYSISYPVVYDCEGFKNTDSRMYSLNAEQRTQNALAFLSIVKSAGYEGMFYGSKSDLTDNTSFNTEKISSSYKIWLAHYSTPTYPTVENPEYSGKYDMWQYTNKGSVSGVEGNVDLIVSYFTKAQEKPKDESQTPPSAEPPKTQAELLYTDVNDKVTAKSEVNLRSGAGTNFDIVGTLKNGTVLSRTGVGKNGWSRLSYGGQPVYAITSYLTDDLTYTAPAPDDIVEGNTFTASSGKVTPKELVNLRSLPTTSSQIVASVKNGEVLERTATSDKGWTRLLYGGQTVYAVSSYLTDDLTYKPPTTEAPTNDGINTEFTTVNEQVTAKSETNLRTLPSVKNSEIVYTLKNGEYVTRTGVSTNGYSRLVWNGQTVYAVSSLLTN